MPTLQHIQWSERNQRPPHTSQRATGHDSSAAGSGATLRKVLVVDDERDLADITAVMLRFHGLDVVVAYCAQEALQVLESDTEIDAVFSDVVMPAMNGLELAETVQKRYPSVKIVLASGYAQPALLAAGNRTFLYTTKPYKIQTILELLLT